MEMAPPIASEPHPPSSTAPGQTQNLRNPLPLSASQEAQVRDIYYKRVRSRCADEIKEFAKCAQGRTLTVTWACKAQQFAMNSCMIAHATKAEEDAAREDWFAGVIERRLKKEEELAAVEKRRVEIIDMTRKQEEKEKAELELKSPGQDKLATSKKSSWFWGR
ncbi:uncharacterized protein A1O9_12316 [Exophiala aquamarina CBS 119918]|uniref:COX assembly mitochondrial protein n=1 Tax=Exophiala aquamarina CBS 119918 TaxID=1182545 RepID=A0A072NVQ6_9EURO|nr:uncharacterized protein A1O9_12316 [Exophiala aquamarina CBS 119918]KEF51681.1 hypothetical protein A1O9_12316 [Exophiala aquamarina CBS 119918]